MSDNQKTIAVTCDGVNGLDSEVFGHFGHSPAFAFVQIDGTEVTDWRMLPNPAAEQHKPGQVPAFVREQGAGTILTGNMGARAVAIFDHFDVEVIRGVSGSVRDAVGAYLRGERPTPLEQPCGGGQGHGGGGGCGGHGHGHGHGQGQGHGHGHGHG